MGEEQKAAGARAGSGVEWRMRIIGAAARGGAGKGARGGAPRSPSARGVRSGVVLHNPGLSTNQYLAGLRATERWCNLVVKRAGGYGDLLTS